MKSQLYFVTSPLTPLHYVERGTMLPLHEMGRDGVGWGKFVIKKRPGETRL
ncbi:MAG: hypothetical protein ACD_80C00018G0001 [uncultured bacterium (gcode 4)]|uniref:Uncharacterized protein n=1 Tax=uncultured bacterium (gcode 4) TaxID=1234023 RepID=K1XK80_9BACT|nr:MAG: hypothetical protein ACD_80C00018G0001 [uncultured bacterium (gcode 4)]